MLSERQVSAVSGTSTGVLVRAGRGLVASTAVPPPVPCPQWHAPGTARLWLAQILVLVPCAWGPKLSTARCECWEGSSAADEPKLSVTSLELCLSHPAAHSFLPITKQLFPSAHIQLREWRNRIKLIKMVFTKIMALYCNAFWECVDTRSLRIFGRRWEGGIPSPQISAAAWAPALTRQGDVREPQGIPWGQCWGSGDALLPVPSANMKSPLHQWPYLNAQDKRSWGREKIHRRTPQENQLGAQELLQRDHQLLFASSTELLPIFRVVFQMTCHLVTSGWATSCLSLEEELHLWVLFPPGF